MLPVQADLGILVTTFELDIFISKWFSISIYSEDKKTLLGNDAQHTGDLDTNDPRLELFIRN